jgi:hypothetical protein
MVNKVMEEVLHQAESKVIKGYKRGLLLRLGNIDS